VDYAVSRHAGTRRQRHHARAVSGFPEAHSYGDDVADALAHAQDALATVIDAYIKDKRAVPRPSPRVARHYVTVPALIEAKLALYEAMQTARVGKAELARRLDCHLPQIDRLLAMTHGSQFGQLEAAFQALGLRLVVGVEPLPPAPSRRRRPATPRRRARTRATA
jgi:antitoxin HicB